LPKRVAILGASGFIGRRIYETLGVTGPYSVTGYSSEDCNLLDLDQVKHVLSRYGADTTVVFCSAIRRTRDDSFAALVQNVTMVHNFIEGVPPTGLRSVLFFSSVDVYGRPPTVVPTNEKSPTQPSEYYGVAKLAGEQLLQMRLARQFPVAVLRIPGIYGLGDQFRSVIGSFLQQVQRDEVVRVSGDGTALRDYVEVTDVAQVVHKLIEQPYNGIVNVVTGRSVAIRDIVQCAASAMGKQPLVELCPDIDSKGDLVWDSQVVHALCPDIEFMPVERGIEQYAQALRR
jgi:nucleoside-diphosphate-sugar epimerase